MMASIDWLREQLYAPILEYDAGFDGASFVCVTSN